jgi:glycosyltransferase involved in cell wall biosynthesis
MSVQSSPPTAPAPAPDTAYPAIPSRSFRAPGQRVLIVAPTPFFADRGCHVRILGEAQALIELGHEVLVCTYPLGRDVPGIPTERTLPVPWYHKLSAGPSVHKFYIDALLIGKVLAACRRFRPDIIHAHLHEGIVIAKIASTLFRIPMVADLQGSLTSELLDHKFIPKAPWFVKGMQRIEGTINGMPRHLIVSSTRTARACRDSFGLPESRITPVMDGVDLKVYSPRPPDPALRASLGILPHEKLVVFIGVLTEYQGIDLLLKAVPLVMKELPAAKFLIIGYPEEGYKEKARALGIADRTVFTGRIPYDQAPAYLSLGDVAVSPKVSTTEANLKLYNYMAMGLPSVVFDNEVNREILGDLGIYAPTPTPEALTGALLSILRAPERAAEIRARSLARASAELSWTAVGRQLLDIYADVRSRSRGPLTTRGT